jgi:heavy metal translocating P-type ATPase
MSDQPGACQAAEMPAACDYCGLPVAGAVCSEGPAYCCFGCRFAAAVTGARGETGETRWMATVLGLSVFCTMNVVMLTMALWSYAATPRTPFAAALADFLRAGAMLFSAPVALMLGRPLARNALDQLRRGTLSTDLLLLTGVAAAFAVSVTATIRGQGHVYYEVGCVILVLVTLGRWLEAMGRLQASAALEELERLIPETVRLVDDHGAEHLVPRDTLGIGSQVRVLAGERCPVDGRVMGGAAVVDEQFFTGEAVPVEKFPGDAVLGGSLNLDGELLLRATARPTAGALGRLIEAVRTARLTKGRYQVLADRWSQRFFPIIGLVAAATWIGHGWSGNWETALLASLSVVLIACPCALALATPLAIWAALAAAARRGVLFRGGPALERLAAVRAVRWDKTGTLTTGTPSVRRILCAREEERPCVERFAQALAAASNHVFSRAIREELAATTAPCAIGVVHTLPGRGLKANVPDYGSVVLGSAHWMAECGLTCGPVLQGLLARETCSPRSMLGTVAGAATERREAEGSASVVFIGWQGEIRGAFVLEETLRPEAATAVAECQRLQLEQAVLTGDRLDRAHPLQTALGLPVHARLLPEEKLAAIRAARGAAGAVAMVGDGLNDAPALAAADVGIALGCGADVSRDAADVCLLPNDLRLVPWAIRHARRTVRTIRQNLLWSFGYNSVGVVAAALGSLHPALAAVLMVGSSLMVLGNSLRLRGNEHDPAAMPGQPPYGSAVLLPALGEPTP